MTEPRLIDGGLAVDDRGEVGFVNDFDFEGVRRFYTVCNHRAGFIRAWHAHRREAKAVTVVQGAAVVAAVAIPTPPEAEIHRFVLSGKAPKVLCIPPGYANGFMTLTADAVLIFFSSSSLDESLEDDMRYDAHHWDAWQIEER